MVALVIIYNHQYNDNIDVLENIYKKRFTDIYHIVPFYNGDKENVFSVYECSYYFQGYVAQSFMRFYDEKYSHYIFIADDLLLNPSIDENNYNRIFNLTENSSFIPDFITLHEVKGFWNRVGEAYRWKIKKAGIEAIKQLPNYESTISKFKNLGLLIKPLKFSQINYIPGTFISLIKYLFNDNIFQKIIIYCEYIIQDKIKKHSYNLPYPFVGSYSDVFIVSSKAIKDFCHYCGVFAATRLHVEVAVPTSIVMSSERITTEKDLKLQGKALWVEEDYQELDKYENSLNNLLDDFPSNYLYLHPIKLSKWMLGN